MIFPVKRGEITTPFDQPRPLSVPKERRTHPHGAIDIAAPVGTAIRAPEDGTLYYFCAVRSSLARTMAELELLGPFDMSGHHYFYDTYGALIIIIGDSGNTHVMCHSYLNQLYNQAPMRVRWTYTESAEQERWPLMAWHTFEDPTPVQRGQVVGSVGSAGFSTGAHAHYEIHRGTTWNPHAERVRPETFWPELVR